MSLHVRYVALHAIILQIATALGTTTLSASDALEIREGPTAIEISTPSGPLLEYAFSGVPYKPYVRTFRTPRGVNVLRDSPFDHKHHHALMYAIAAEGVSYWVEDENAGTQRHCGFPFTGAGRAGAIPAAGFVERLDWRPPRSETAVLWEKRSITAYDPAALGASVLTWSARIKPAAEKGSVKLHGEHYYGLGVRFLESMDKGGRFLPPKVREGELVRGTEKVAPGRWCAYVARADGEPVTVAMFDHPSNPRPALWFTMEAPFAYISATINLWREPLMLEAGKELSLRYGFAVWDGEKDEEAIESLYRRWLEVSEAELSAEALKPERSEQRRRAVLEGMQAAMGELPDRSKLPPLDVRELGRVEEADHTRIEISFESGDGDRIPADLYLPKPKVPGKKYPAAIALHPTHPLGKRVIGVGSPEPNRSYAPELARRGYIVIAPDYPSFGDYPYDFENDRYASGTMKGIFNHMRCVDLLVSRDDVDPNRIAAIGHSLGGHNAIFVAAFDERIRAVVSSCGWTPFHDYYGGKLEGWASPRYIPRLRDVYGLDPDRVPFDFYEVIASLAPRGFFSSSPLRDDNFEVSGVRKATQEALEVYKLFGAADRLEVVYPDCGHDFPPEVRERAYRFLDRMLGSKEAE